MGVVLEIILTVITLAVAIAGTLWEKPPKSVKISLIALAIAASLGAIIKSFLDESDKDFMKRVLISNLSPSNSAYKNLEADVANHFAQQGYDDWACFHTDGGMACFSHQALIRQNI